MHPTSRRTLFNAIRVIICVLALWLVARGVALRDRVTLRTGETLVGYVVETGDPLVLRLSDGTRRSIPADALAVDDQGQPRVELGLWTAVAGSRHDLLALAVLIFLPVGFLQGVRLRVLLRVQSIDVGLWDCVKLSFAGNFLNFATPLGSNAGDVAQAYFITTHTHRKTEAASTIAFDRAIGLTTLVLCVALIAFLSGAERLRLVRPYVLGFLILAAAAVALYFSPAVRRRLRPGRWLERLPAHEQLRRIDQAARTLAGHLPALALSWLITLLLQVLAIGAYYTVALAVGMEGGWSRVLEYYAYFYAGAVIQALPGPPQGLGTVELAYRYFFAPYGSASQIVSMALLGRIVVLVCALPGLWITMTGAYRPREGDADARTVSADAEATGRSNDATARELERNGASSRTHVF
ncbi:MAG: UPF0104 family protein [Planctomycetota bacterium]|nr:MAG: UPF0104 family protein [Planctomycetota bacterium]